MFKAVMVVDDRVSMVGSANMDTSSWYYASETNLMIEGDATARRLVSTVFNPAWRVSPATI